MIERSNRRRLVKGALMVGPLLVGGKYARDFLAEASQEDLLGKPREGDSVWEIELTPIVNQQREVVNPVIRSRPQSTIIGKSNVINQEDLEKQGIDLSGNTPFKAQGRKVWGATYVSLDRRGMAYTDEKTGRMYGKWTAIINEAGNTVGYVSENFVTYKHKKAIEKEERYIR